MGLGRTYIKHRINVQLHVYEIFRHIFCQLSAFILYTVDELVSSKRSQRKSMWTSCFKNSSKSLTRNWPGSNDVAEYLTHELNVGALEDVGVG